jgi:hypothetical protein
VSESQTPPAKDAVGNTTGNSGIPPDQYEDTQKQIDKAAQADAQAAAARQDTGVEPMTYAEYDAVGKGPDYEPSPEAKAHNAKADKAVADAQKDAEAAASGRITPSAVEAERAERATQKSTAKG